MKILKLMEIHTTYIQGLASFIKQIRYVCVVAIVGIISSFYAKGCHQTICLFLLGSFSVTIVSYIVELPFQFWQSSHLNRIHDLYEKLDKNLNSGKDSFTYKPWAEGNKKLNLICLAACGLPTTTWFYSMIFIVSFMFLIGIQFIRNGQLYYKWLFSGLFVASVLWCMFFSYISSKYNKKKSDNQR